MPQHVRHDLARVGEVLHEEDAQPFERTLRGGGGAHLAPVGPQHGRRLHLQPALRDLQPVGMGDMARPAHLQHPQGAVDVGGAHGIVQDEDRVGDGGQVGRGVRGHLVAQDGLGEEGAPGVLAEQGRESDHELPEPLLGRGVLDR